MRRALFLALAALWCALLGGAVWRGLTEPVAAPRLDLAAVASVETAADRVRLARPPASAHRVVVERPVFAPTRRPPPAAEAAPAAPPPPAPDFRVVGTMSMNGAERALVSVDGAAPVLVGLGETLDGWRVAAIEGRAITFEHPGERTDDGAARSVLADMDAAPPEAGGDRRGARPPQRASARRPARDAPAAPGGTFVRFTQIDD